MEVEVVMEVVMEAECEFYCDEEPHLLSLRSADPGDPWLSSSHSPLDHFND